MKRTASLPIRQVRHLAHKALKALGFVNFGLLFQVPQPASATLAPSTELPAQGTAREADSVQDSLCRLQIPCGDWDLLFRSVQLRLTTAAQERLASDLSSQSGEAAAHFHAVVLDCVSDMDQLRTALTLEHR